MNTKENYKMIASGFETITVAAGFDNEYLIRPPEDRPLKAGILPLDPELREKMKSTGLSAEQVIGDAAQAQRRAAGQDGSKIFIPDAYMAVAIDPKQETPPDARQLVITRDCGLGQCALNSQDPEDWGLCPLLKIAKNQFDIHGPGDPNKHIDYLKVLAATSCKEKFEASIETGKLWVERAMLQDRVDTDPLTGASTRSKLFEDFKKLRKNIDHLVIIALDLNNFKAINDTKGHQFGDQTLKNVVERCRNILAVAGVKGDIYRLGGDEFAIMITDAVDTQFEVIKQTLQLPFDAGPDSEACGMPDGFTFSLGFSVRKGRQKIPSGLDRMISEADEAMYRQKPSGRFTRNDDRSQVAA